VGAPAAQPENDKIVNHQVDHEVVIVGSGFAGIGQAIALKRNGIDDFVILEKAGALGGTWRDNTYPGCACDIPSHLYSFSYEPNPQWSRTYSPAAEIHGYLKGCSARYGVDPHLRVNQRLEAARYDEATGIWTLTSTGLGLSSGRHEIRCRAVVLALGALHEPAYPDIPGLEGFTGDSMHTAAWDHSISLQGKRIGVLGTGASTIQVVPEIADLAAHLTVFQRTPPWILPKADHEFSAATRARFARFPLLAKAERARIYWQNESRVMAFASRPSLMRFVAMLARRHLRKQVPDPMLRAELTPGYTIGCKRILVSNDYYPALSRQNVSLVTTPIDHIEGSTVVTADRARHDVDVLILGTGFRPNGSYDHIAVTGVGGRNLAQEWAVAQEAHLGLTVAGYPNLFTLVGPNTGLGHNSMLIMIEAQVELVVQALRERDRRGATSIAVRPEVQAQYNAELQDRSRAAVWLTGCRSWYLDASGHNRAMWPGSTVAFRRRTRHLREDEYCFGDVHDQINPHSEGPSAQ
jgi:cation diffusion facilitator CzcD-associated flavoprotein CzcO